VSWAAGEGSKFRRERMISKAGEDHVMMAQSSRTLKAIHISRWSVRRIGRKGGDIDRTSDRNGKVAGSSEGRKYRDVKCRNRWQKDSATMAGGRRRTQTRKGGWYDKYQQRREERKASEKKSATRQIGYGEDGNQKAWEKQGVRYH